MLIGLFRDSVMRCFCHTCSVNSAIAGRHMYKKPLSKKINKKPRCKQPKKIRRNHATEIRAEEKSRGGMSYEVILSQAVSERPTSPTQSATSPKSITRQDIDSKMDQAEQRRKTLEAERVASISERLCRLEEAARKRQEANDEFITTTAAAFDLKLDAITANREAHLDALRAKVAEHLSSVESVRKNMEEQTEKLRGDLLSKMSSAQENRDDHLRTIMAKLQAHEAGVQRVRASHDAAVAELDERIKTKQDVAFENREAELTKKIEALRQHLNKVVGVKEQLCKKNKEQSDKLRLEIADYESKISKLKSDRSSRSLHTNVQDKVEQVITTKDKEIETRVKEVEEKINAKLTIAEKNRTELAEKAKKAREEQDRRAEMVRANKKSISASNSSTSSG